MTIKPNSHIAILQTAFIGDVVLTFPLAQVLKNAYPECKITFITTPQSYELAKTCIAIDNVIKFDKRNNHKKFIKIIKFAKELNTLNFDYIITPHRSFRSSFLVSRLKNCTKIGYKNASLSLIYDYKIDYVSHYHEIERNLEFLQFFPNAKALNLTEVETKFTDDDINFISTITNEYNIDFNRLIVIAPGSVWATKRWKKEYYTMLSDKLIKKGYQVVLTGSKQDMDLCNFIAESSNCINLAGITNIPQTLYLIGKSKLVITNDSAPTHFAGLMNTPIITIFGPTSPIFGFAPRSDKSKILRNEELKCSPCRIHGSEKCPIGTHECMISITPNMVFAAAEELLN